MPTAYVAAVAMPGPYNSLNSFALNEATDAAEVVFYAADAATITHLGFNYLSRTGTPPTYRISLQGVTTGGLPDGTVKGGGSPASATFTPPADATWNVTFQWVALANSYTCTRGELLAWVIDYSSGTVDGSNYSSFGVRSSWIPGSGLPYSIDNNAGSRTRGLGAVFGYKSASTVYGFPMLSVMMTAFSSDSTPDEYGMSFVWGSAGEGAYTISAVQVMVTAAAAGKTIKVSLYTGTTLLQQTTWDSDVTQSLGAASVPVLIPFQDATLATLTAGERYRIALAPQETAANLAVHTIKCGSAADAACFAGGAWYKTTRTDGGAWTDDTAQVPEMIPIISTNAPSGGRPAYSDRTGGKS